MVDDWADGLEFMDSKRVVFVQHGDYRESALRFAGGEEETYYAQRYSVDLVARLAEHAAEVCVICVTAGPYEERLPTGVRVIGTRVGVDSSMRGLVRLVAAQRPSHLIPRAPLLDLLRWGRSSRIRVLPLFADSFPSGGPRTQLRYWALARELNRPNLPVIANHNTGACEDLARLGVKRGKIVPWDWPPAFSPHETAPRTAPQKPPFKLIYVGHLSEAKGLGDTLDAVALLCGKGLAVRLTVVGGDSDEYRRRVASMRLGRIVTFAGRVPHRLVIRLMREHDAVIVASRHTYPEGLPMTIYDALSARTPLVASDHPMFRGKLSDGENAVVFRAARPESMATAVERLIGTPELWAALSERAAEAWDRLRCKVVWGELLLRWLRDSEQDRQWLSDHSLH